MTDAHGAGAGQAEGGANASGRGEPVIRTAPMPSDCNNNGDIFGGWVLSQMDVAGGIVASRRARGRVVTVAITAMRFNQPIRVGDVVSIYGHVSKVGKTSISVELETIVTRKLDPDEIKVTEGTFVFVAIDSDGQPRPVEAQGQT
ncbi:acyl-CoA thioesterase [Marinibaculum pumilum]|uniref:Acyl-CoA thioesterase n=1 Tax=Marinibaculum pumilum TaxID=1766165 RepID=A0ABV7KWK6_9PROT